MKNSLEVLTWKPKVSAHLENLGGDGRKYLEGFFQGTEPNDVEYIYVSQDMGLNALLGYDEQANVPTFCIQGD
jgi:hypothetical protein